MKKQNDFVGLFSCLLLSIDDGDEKEMVSVCDYLKKIEYERNSETENLQKKIASIFSKYEGAVCALETSILFLKYVDIEFLRDFLLDSPEGTFKKITKFTPKRDMCFIVKRIAKSDFLSDFEETLTDVERSIFLDLQSK